MSFQFATCDRHMALQFLRSEYPSRAIEDTPEGAGPLLDLIAQDVIRVQDPAYHQPCQIVGGKNWDDARKDEVMAICVERLSNSPLKEPTP